MVKSYKYHKLSIITVLAELVKVDVCDVTLSVYPHRASLKNMPGKSREEQ